MDRRTELANRPLESPARSRLPLDHPYRAQLVATHAEAVASGEAGYLDPATGLFVLTASFLAARGYCCERGCRHCPYVEDDDGTASASDAGDWQSEGSEFSGNT